MTWFLKLPDGERLDIEDLPMSAYVAIEAETGAPWYEVAGNPYRHAGGALALLKHVLPTHGVEVPELTPKTFVQWFEWVDEDSLPTGGTTGPTEISPASPLEVDEA